MRGAERLGASEPPVNLGRSLSACLQNAPLATVAMP